MKPDITLHVVGARTFEIKRISKHTLHAFIDGKQIASGPSNPKLIGKIEDWCLANPYTKPNTSVTKGVFRAKSPQLQNIPKSAFGTFIDSKGKEQRMSMRQLTLDAMLVGKNDEEVLDIIATHWPNKKYNMTHVKWYRSNFAKSEHLSAEHAPKGSKIYKEWEKKNTK